MLFVTSRKGFLWCMSTAPVQLSVVSVLAGRLRFWGTLGQRGLQTFLHLLGCVGSLLTLWIWVTRSVSERNDSPGTQGIWVSFPSYSSLFACSQITHWGAKLYWIGIGVTVNWQLASEPTALSEWSPNTGQRFNLVPSFDQEVPEIPNALLPSEHLVPIFHLCPVTRGVFVCSTCLMFWIGTNFTWGPPGGPAPCYG